MCPDLPGQLVEATMMDTSETKDDGTNKSGPTRRTIEQITKDQNRGPSFNTSQNWTVGKSQSGKIASSGAEMSSSSTNKLTEPNEVDSKNKTKDQEQPIKEFNITEPQVARGAVMPSKFVFGKECDNNSQQQQFATISKSTTARTSKDENVREQKQQEKAEKILETTQAKTSIRKKQIESTTTKRREDSVTSTQVAANNNMDDHWPPSLDFGGDENHDGGNSGKEEEDDDDDDDNQVIPSWPSKSDAFHHGRSHEFIQHKVYSLKDYSQVASPTIAATSTLSSTGGQQQQLPASASSSSVKLFNKSMSQDRKVKAKRMSECLHQTGGFIGSKQSSFGLVGGASSAAAGGHHQTSGSFSLIGDENSGSLLAAVPAGSRQAALLCESRIDRMRKLFVSPLSLRSSNVSGGGVTAGSVTSISGTGLTTSGTVAGTGSSAGASSQSSGGSGGGAGGGKVFLASSAGQHVAAAASVAAAAAAASGNSSGNSHLIDGTSTNSATAAGATANPRLSFQAGASNMLNKGPHHLMHAVYSRGGGAIHHSRRSPMCQKQGKSFRVYGCPLQLANNIYPITCFGRADIYKQQSVPYVLARLCNYIEENSSQLTHEGIFRVSGNARLMEKLRTLFDHLGDAPLESESVDVATSASMLKMYLRELPEPLIPARMNYYFIALAKKYSPLLTKETLAGYSGLSSLTAAANVNSSSSASSSVVSNTNAAAAIELQQQQAVATSSSGGGGGGENQSLNERQKLAFVRDLTKLIRKLPIENYNLLKYLACFLYRISLKQQYNKMCAEALGIVFGPNVFRIRSESYKGLKEQELTNQVMASIIRNYRVIFDSELTDPLGNVVVAETTPTATTASSSVDEVTTVNSAQSSLSKASVIESISATTKQLEATTVTTEVTPEKINTTTTTTTVIKATKSPVETTTFKRIAGENNTSGAAFSTSGGLAPIPSTSKQQTAIDTEALIMKNVDGNLDIVDRRVCCPRHCQDYLLDSRDDEEDDDGNEDVDDDIDGEDNRIARQRANRNNDEDFEDISDEEEEEDDSDNDDDDDDDDYDEGESYTPSTGSGSYCSSMDSETLESSYEGGQGPSAEHGSRLSNVTSSECESDTSYTPTSSHTDNSDQHDADASFYGNSSSFESSPSFVRRTSSSRRVHHQQRQQLAEGGEGGDQTTRQHDYTSAATNLGQNDVQRGGDQPDYGQSTAPSSCLICKRRQSAHLVNAANFSGTNGGGSENKPLGNNRETHQATRETASKAATINETTATDVAAADGHGDDGLSALHAENVPIKVDLESALDDKDREAFEKHRQDNRNNGRDQLCLPTRKGGSCKKKKSSDVGTKTSTTSIGKQHQATKGRSASGQAQHETSQGGHGKVRHSSGRHKVDFLRRRSSSASSLSRMKHRRDQLLAYQRKVLREEHKGGVAERSSRRLNADGAQVAKARGSDTRRAQGKAAAVAHLAVRRAQETIAGELSPCDSSSTRNSKRGGLKSGHKVRGSSQRAKATQNILNDDPLTPNIAGLLPQQQREKEQQVVDIDDDHDDEPSIDHEHLIDLEAFASTYTNDTLDYEQFFQLRSFNSDETLLRSVNYCSEFPIDQDERPGTSGNFNRHRRRFSGHDLDLSSRQPGLRAIFQRQPCEQIFEGHELTGSGEDANGEEFGSSFDASPAVTHSNYVQSKDQQKAESADAVVATATSESTSYFPNNKNFSFVSLIDNRSTETGFRNSELSLNELVCEMNEQPDANSSGEDPILIQMKANKEMMKTLCKLSRRVNHNSAQIEWLLKKLSDEPSGKHYLDDFTTCFVDHLTAKNLADQLDTRRAFETLNPEGEKEFNLDDIEETKIEQLTELLNARVVLFKQKYNNLKSIRDHISRNHHDHTKNHIERDAPLGGCSKSKSHGNLNVLQTTVETSLCSNQPASTTHRQRKLSVPNKTNTIRASSDRGISVIACDVDMNLRSSLQQDTQTKSRDSDNDTIDDLRPISKPPMMPLHVINQQRQTKHTEASEQQQQRQGTSTKAVKCKFGSLCPVEFVFNIEKQLALKRISGARWVKLNEMTIEQLQSEKLDLQKNLLRYEHWFGRPATRQDSSFVGHLYERYRAVKMIISQKQQLTGDKN